MEIVRRKDAAQKVAKHWKDQYKPDIKWYDDTKQETYVKLKKLINPINPDDVDKITASNFLLVNSISASVGKTRHFSS